MQSCKRRSGNGVGLGFETRERARPVEETMCWWDEKPRLCLAERFNADCEKLVKGSADRFCWFLDLLNNEFGNRFDLRAE
jgi:hypothetical protein